MTIESTRTGSELLVKIAGRLDSVTAGELEAKLQTDMTEDISGLTVDLADVDFVSSKGLRVLVSAYRQLQGKHLTLAGPNPSVYEVLKLSGLLKIFTIQ